MVRRYAAIMTSLGIAVFNSFGGTDVTQPANQVPEWEYSLSIATYLQQHARDYANPTFTADHDWLHLEARYNYEAIKTGSVWLGYNFSVGDKLKLEATPMIGGVFGDITGVAPGYMIGISYEPFEFYTQGEYFFDANIHAGNFFYTWSEISWKPRDWCRVGLVIDRTKVVGTDVDVRRGPLIGFSYKEISFTTYWLSPGSRDATFVFAVEHEF